MKHTFIVTFMLLAGGLYAANLPRLIDQTEAKVVKIGIVTDKATGTCSGAFISPSGLVLTCAHCFAHAEMQKVFIKQSNGEAHNAFLLKISTTTDLALLEPEYALVTPYFEMGSQPKKGQQVLSFGSPLGLQSTVGIGWVANILTKGDTFIFHSAFINPGNSGGPLVDLKGRLIGVNEAIMMIDFIHMAQGLYIAIDISTVKGFIHGYDKR